MNKCSDTKIGKQLHDYEMGWLSDDDQERFELHMMSCQYCFEEATQFERVTRLLSVDEKIKHSIADSVKSETKDVTFWSRLRDLFWPKTNLFLKPAFVYLALLVLLPLAYQGVRDDSTQDNKVRLSHTVDLVANRGSLLSVQKEQGMDLVIRFAFDGAHPGSFYKVTLISETIGTIYSGDRFQFDSQQAAQLSIPHDLLSAGQYQIIIEDPEDTSVLGTDTLSFRIIEK